MKKYYGEEFINKIYRNLFESDIVKRSGKGSNKNEDVSLYFDRLERISKKAIDHNKYDKIKQFYYEKYVISPNDIKEEYFKKQEQLALDRGYGHIKYNQFTIQKEKEKLIKEQKESLDSWLDYFASDDTKYYPIWFKYFCFQGMVRIGYFDKERNQYTKRTKNTIKPFIEINREAIAMLYDFMIKHLNKEKLDDNALEQLINNGNFSKIYAYCIKKLDSVKKNKTKSEDGKWVKYNQGSDPEILFNDIHGKGTGWCTAGGIETAKAHIEEGDFYVYYTKDEKGEYTNPRIAIRMEWDYIAEIRGIGEKQNLEPNMERVVEEKLKEFPDKEAYKKKVKDMEMLTYIYTKWKQKIELTNEDLRFIYEIDSKILGFGYQKDPRIKEIIETRNKEMDLSKIFDCNSSQISLTKENALKDNVICHCGDLALFYMTNGEKINLPQNVIGDLKLTRVDGLTLPQSVGGNLDLNNLTSAEGLTLPQSVGGNLFLDSLTRAEGLTLPQTVGGDLYLNNLTRAEGLTLPQSIGGSLYLTCLTDVENLILPQNIGGDLYLNRLTSAEGLMLPQRVGGELDLSGLKSTKGLKLPKNIGRSIYLKSLKSAEGLTLPQSIVGDLDLSGLTSTKGLKFPQNIGKSIYLNSLTSAEGLTLPQSIGGDLDLGGLKSTKGLKLPKNIGRSIYLSSLTSVEGLTLPESIDGGLYLNCLTDVENLTLPQSIGGDLYLNSLTSVEGLMLPQRVGGELDLNGLTSVEGLIIPDTLNCKLYCSIAKDIDELREMCKKNSKKIIS